MENENLRTPATEEVLIKNKTEPSKRPLSYYENTEPEKKEVSAVPPANNNNANKECKFTESPTQTHFLNTTVPLNIGRQDIAGKHTPTRNSLRHSRMIVLNRSGQVTSSDIPLFLKYNKLVKSLLIVTIVLGVSLCFLSLWLLLWSPNIRSRDNPYWSAIPVLISGIIGIIFVNYCPKVYSNRNVSYWIRSIKYISILASVIAVIASLLILLFALIHIIALSAMTCSPPDKINATCVCKTNSTDETPFSSYHYVDLSCSEVSSVLSILIVFTCITNAVVVVFELIYLYLHWASRKVYLYARVPVNGDAMRIYKTNR